MTLGMDITGKITNIYCMSNHDEKSTVLLNRYECALGLVSLASISEVDSKPVLPIEVWCILCNKEKKFTSIHSPQTALVLRLIFSTDPRDFACLVKAFSHGQSYDPDFLDGLRFPASPALSIVVMALDMGKQAGSPRIAAGHEAPFVRNVFLDLIPALTCFKFLERATGYLDLKAEFQGKDMDSLMWVLVFLMQAARRHSQGWMAACGDPLDSSSPIATIKRVQEKDLPTR